MTIPKDLAKKRDEYLDRIVKYNCPDRSEASWIFNAGVLAALSSEHVLALVEALEASENNLSSDGEAYELVEKALANWSKRNEI